jgi:hypothetical protein
MTHSFTRHFIACSTVLLGVLVAGAAEAGTVDGRQARQQARIARGIASGSLTPLETARLERRAAAVARTEAAMRRSGGLSCRERAVLDRRLDRLSAAIRVQTHDGQRHR